MREFPRCKRARPTQFALRSFASGRTRAAWVISAAMKSTISRLMSIFLAVLAAAGVARASPALVGDELAVIQAMAAIMSRDASRPFDFLYFEADFSAHAYVRSSLANPD